MKSREVVEFIAEYIKNDGVIKNPKFLQSDVELKLKWVDIAHALDRLWGQGKIER